MNITCDVLDEWQSVIVEIAEEKDENKRWKLQDRLMAEIESLKMDNIKELHDEHPELHNRNCRCEEEYEGEHERKINELTKILTESDIEFSAGSDRNERIQHIVALIETMT